MYHIDKQRLKRPLCLIMQCLPVAIIIDTRPRNDRPTIIKLPIECSHTIRAIATMRFQAITHTLPLQDKSYIYKILKLLRNNEVTFHISMYQTVSDTTLLMRIHYLRLYFIIFRIGKRRDCLHFRERLKTKFTHKSSQFRIG